MDGLIKLVQFKATKPGEIDLTHFDQVVFIDSGYPTPKSLPTEFKDAHGGNVEPETALAKNAFEAKRLQEMFPETADLLIANSVYQPETGSGEHGHSIVTLTVATIDKKKVLVVDPDDADDTVVAWTTNNPPPPHDVLVVSASHHGSRYSSPKLLMQNGWKPQAVVFQANAANRFEHPHPETWAAWVKELGVQNVHITGAEGDVKVSGRGLEPLTREDLANIFETILKPKVEAAKLKRADAQQRGGSSRLARVNSEEAALKELHEAYKPHVDRKVITALGGDWPFPRNGRGPPRDPGDPPTEPGTPRGPVAPQGPSSPWWDAGGEGVAGTNPQTPRQPNGPGSDGVTFERDGGPRTPNSGLAFAPGEFPRQAGTGGFKALRDQGVERAGGLPEASGARPTRAARFSSSISGPIVWGGIVIGNEVKGPELQVTEVALQLPSIVDGEEVGSAEIIVSGVADGIVQTVSYREATLTELVCAWRFVFPPADWASKETYALEEADCGVLGIVKNEAGVWHFGIHPGVADTSLARSGMVVDMLPAIVKELPELAKVSRFAGLRDPRMENYQWFDLPSKVQIGGGFAKVVNQEDTKRPLLTLRAVQPNPNIGTAKDFRQLLTAMSHPTSPLHIEPQAAIQKLFELSADLNALDRFARAVAFLHWAKERGKGLMKSPDLEEAALQMVSQRVEPQLDPTIVSAWLKNLDLLDESPVLAPKATIVPTPDSGNMPTPVAVYKETSTEAHPEAKSPTGGGEGGGGALWLTLGLLVATAVGLRYLWVRRDRRVGLNRPFHHILPCADTKCPYKLRVPTGRGRLRVTCPKCGTEQFFDSGDTPAMA